MNIIKEISIFLKETIKNKLKYIVDKYIFYINESTLIYKMDDKKIRLFGNEFIKNNKDNYYLIIENKKINLCELYNLKYENKNNYVKVKLIQKDNVTNMSYMFYDCSSLISLPDISNWNTNNVTNMSWMFNNCSSLIYLPDMNNFILSSNNYIFFNFCKIILLI